MLLSSVQKVGHVSCMRSAQLSFHCTMRVLISCRDRRDADRPGGESFGSGEMAHQGRDWEIHISPQRGTSKLNMRAQPPHVRAVHMLEQVGSTRLFNKVYSRNSGMIAVLSQSSRTIQGNDHSTDQALGIVHFISATCPRSISPGKVLTNNEITTTE